MSDLTIQDLVRLTHMPDNPGNPAEQIAGQKYYDIEFTGGSISNVTLTDVTINGTVTSRHETIVTAAGQYVVQPVDYVVTINKTVPEITTVTLPASPTTSRSIIVKDGAGNAGDFNITINANGKTIDGVSTYTIDADFQAIELIYNGTQWNALSVYKTYGDVVGPVVSTDNSIARFDGTTGRVIQNSGIIISDANNITGATSIVASNFVGSLIGNADTATNVTYSGITAVPAYSLLGNSTNVAANASNIRYPVLGVPGYTVVSASTFGRITGSNAGFYEFNIQNTLANASASTDFVVTADNGSGTTHYLDMGINSSLGGAAPFINANAAYLYTTDNELDLAAIGATGIVNIYAGATPTLIASFNNNGVVTMPGLVSGIVVADASGVLSTRSTAMVWNDTTGTTQALAVNNGYVADNASLVTYTLPATAAFGSIISIVGKGAGGWILAQNSGQTVHYSGKDTTTGVGGSIASTQQRDCLDLVCTTANTDWTVRSSIGSPNVT